ncbi:MAG TPA: riboflavin synthase [Selenomonadales bacterium]|nr:riboflavin synthase [Selenomonadales bacterium]
MFTGIVEELGKIKTVVRGAKSVRLTVGAPEILGDVKLGDSIAVNGTCLTVVEYSADWFTADVMPETMDRSSLSGLRPGAAVNLERALRLGDRLGGHIVSGHIDGVGTIRAKEQDDNAVVVRIEAPPAVMRYVVVKGSIAVDGISLTVVACGPDWFTVSMIPHTAAVTTLGIKKTGEPVNLETDVLGKYVERLMGLAGEIPAPQKRLTNAFLAEHGFI